MERWTREPGPTGRHGRRARAFSLIELLVVIGVIAVIAAIVFAALGGARAQARRSADTSLARTIQTGVEQFRTDFGFLPPLVKDNLRWDDGGGETRKTGYLRASLFGSVGPVFSNSTDWFNQEEGAAPLVNAASPRPNAFSFSLANNNEDDRDYLRRKDLGVVPIPGNDDEADLRFSVLSLSYYLVGVLPANVDGVDGPGFSEPRQSGGFDLRGNRKPSYVDLGSSGELLARGGDLGERSVLVDSNGTPIRFYRWLPGDGGGDNQAVIEDIADLNIPLVVGAQSGTLDLTQNPRPWGAINDPEVRAAGYAIAIAGADGLFGDPGTEDRAALLESTGAADPGTDQLGWFSVATQAADDNTVLVGKP